MGNYAFIVPEGLTNLVSNPSVEINTTGFAAMAGAIARILTQQRRGAACLQVTPAAGVNDGAYYGTVSLVNTYTYTFSLDVKGVLGVPYKIYFGTTGGALLGTAFSFTGTGAWQRVQVTYLETSSTTRRLYITKDNHASTGVYYVDGLMCARQATAADVHTYLDGDQEGCTWAGNPHASQSSRDGQSRGGGRVIDIDSYGVDVLAVTGIGMPPNRHLTQKLAMVDGEVFLGRKVLPRTMSVIMAAEGRSWPGLHALRGALVDAIKPDLVRGDQAVGLRYTGGGRTLTTWGFYDSGLELGTTSWTFERISLRLIGYDPGWYEDGDGGAGLTMRQALTSYLFERANGGWGAIAGLNNAVNAMAIGPDGYLYVGGGFTMGGATTLNYIGKWDGTAWSVVGGTSCNAAIVALLFGPDGSLYAGGGFTVAPDGTAANRIARWNGTAWSALGTGMNGTVDCLALGPNGYLIAGGQFTTAGGGGVGYMAQWDGSTWSMLGSADANGHVKSLAYAPDGSLFAGGNFTTMDGATVNYVAMWNGAWNALGGGMSASGYVHSLAIDEAGRVYAGGYFTDADGVSGTAYVAMWNGSVWSALDGGASNIVYDLRWVDGLLYVGGLFNAVGIGGGYVDAAKLAIWNGSIWLRPDFSPGQCNRLYERNGRLFVGAFTSLAGEAGYVNTVTNPGGRRGFPVMKIKRTGGSGATVAYVANEDTGARIWLNYSLLDGETLTLDFRQGRRVIESDYFGKVWRAALRGSSIGGFDLLPGANKIGVFVLPSGSPTMEGRMWWRLGEWGVD